MKKKIVAMMLVASMTLSMCACGQTTVKESSEASTKSEVSSDASESTETPSSAVVEDEKPLYPIVEEPITLKGIILNGTVSDSDPKRKIWDTVAELTGISIEWEKVSSENLNTRLAGGDWPDIFQADFSTTIVEDYGVVGGRFLNVADYLDYMPHLVKTFEDYPDLKRAMTETNGEMYRLASVNVAATSTSIRPHVNMEVLRNAGVDKKPETIDEFYQALVALKEKNDAPGFVPYINKISGSGWNKMIWSAFGTLVNPDWEEDDSGALIFGRATEQTKRYYAFMNKLYDEGLIHTESATMETMVRYDLEQTSKTIAFVDTAGNGLKAEHFDSGKIELECCIPFTSDYDDTRTLAQQSVIQTAGVFINANTKYPVEICKMLDIIYAEEEVAEGTGLHGMAFVYGPEGVCWVKNPDGKTYTFIYPEEYGSGPNYAKKEWIWGGIGRLDAFANLLPDAPEENSTIRQKAYIESVFPYFTEYEFTKSMLKFTEDEMYVIENKETDIEKYCTEMAVKFITGLEDIESGWDTYLENLNKMGLQELTKVYQAAYDRWQGK